VIPAIRTYPEALQLSTGTFWSEVVTWININFFDTLEAIKNAMLLNVLIPFKRFLGGLPWARRDRTAGRLPASGSVAGAWRCSPPVFPCSSRLPDNGKRP
jgi:hypothetical protein